MSTISSLPVRPEVANALPNRIVSSMGSRFADYLQIAKPRISLMVLVTVSCGYVLGMEKSTTSFRSFGTG